MLQLKKTVAAIALGFGVSTFAQAAVYDLGALNSGQTLNANGIAVETQGVPYYHFADQFTFSIKDLESASFDAVSIDLTFTFGDIKITSMWVNVYYDDGSGNLINWAGAFNDDFKVFGSGPATPGTPDSLGKQTFQLSGDVNFAKFGYNGNYILQVSGETATSGYGAYNLSITGGPTAVVPEPAEYAMLLAGLGLVGMIARRRKV
jgi:hypothetical protein